MKSIWLILIIIIGLLIIVPNLRASTNKTKPASGAAFEDRAKTRSKESYTPKEQHETRVYLTMTTELEPLGFTIIWSKILPQLQKIILQSSLTFPEYL